MERRSFFGLSLLPFLRPLIGQPRKQTFDFQTDNTDCLLSAGLKTGGEWVPSDEPFPSGVILRTVEKVITTPRRTHVQFTGSLQPDDARKVVALLKECVERRPEHCGSFMSFEDLPERTSVVHQVVEVIPVTGDQLTG